MFDIGVSVVDFKASDRNCHTELIVTLKEHILLSYLEYECFAIEMTETASLLLCNRQLSRTIC